MATPKVIISLTVFTLLAGMVSVISGWKLELIASKSPVLGGETTIQCIYDKEDTRNIFPDSLTIESKENGVNTLLVDYSFDRDLMSKEPDDPRYSFNKTTSTLTISRVSCKDKKSFICKVSVSIVGSGLENQQKQFDLDIKVSEPSSKKTESNTGLLVGIGVAVGCCIISSIVMFVIGMYVGKNRVHQERKSKDVTVLRPSPDYEDINEPPLQEAYLEMDSIQLQRGRPQHDLQDMGYEIPKPHRTVDNDDNPYSEYVDIDKISHHNTTSHNHSNVNAHVS